MKPNSVPKLTESLALEGLREASERVYELRKQLEDALIERDEMIREAASWARTSVLCRVTGLTRTQIWRISPGGRTSD